MQASSSENAVQHRKQPDSRRRRYDRRRGRNNRRNGRYGRNRSNAENYDMSDSDDYNATSYAEDNVSEVKAEKKTAWWKKLLG